MKHHVLGGLLVVLTSLAGSCFGADPTVELVTIPIFNSQTVSGEIISPSIPVPAQALGRYGGQLRGYPVGAETAPYSFLIQFSNDGGGSGGVGSLPRSAV